MLAFLIPATQKKTQDLYKNLFDGYRVDLKCELRTTCFKYRRTDNRTIDYETRFGNHGTFMLKYLNYV